MAYIETLKINLKSVVVVVHYTYQHTPYLVAIVNCTHVDYRVRYININIHHILLLLLTVPM